MARRRFLAEGYQAVTLRSIAAEAGVDAALVSYFFGSKQGLFGAALALAANPPEMLVRGTAGRPGDAAGAGAAALLTRLGRPRAGRPVAGHGAAAVQDPEMARLLQEVVEREMVERMADHLGGADARTGPARSARSSPAWCSPATCCASNRSRA